MTKIAREPDPEDPPYRERPPGGKPWPGYPKPPPPGWPSPELAKHRNSPKPHNHDVNT